MALFNRFPFSNAHELNLDWILRQLKDLLRRVKRLEDSGGGGGGGGTTDYLDLDNKPQINGNTLTGNKTAAQLGLGTYSMPAGGIPKTDLTSAVQTSLSKADTALQSVPSTYRTAAAQDMIDAGKLSIAQGSGNAGKFVVVGSDGDLTLVTLATWQGGIY